MSKFTQFVKKMEKQHGCFFTKKEKFLARASWKKLQKEKEILVRALRRISKITEEASSDIAKEALGAVE